MEKIAGLIKRNNEILLSKNKLIKVVAIVGVIALIIGIGYFIYKHFFATDELYDEEFSDEFDEDFFEE